MAYRDYARDARRTLANFTPSNFFRIGDSLNGNSISDEEAIKKAYLGSAVAYTIIRRIAEGVSTLPVEIYNKSNNEVIESGEVYDFVFRPNENQTFMEFWDQLTTYYAITGECYNYLDSDSIGFMEGRQLVLPPQLVTIKTDQDSIFSKVEYYQLQDVKATKKLLPDQVMHVAMNNPTVEGLKNKNGLSPITAAQNILNASNNVEVALAEYFENRGVSMLVSGTGEAGNTMQPSDQTYLQKALNRVLGGARKMNGVHVVKSPVTVNQLNASSTDMQTIENKIQIIRELCAIWGFPSILVNDNTKASYNNVKEAKKEAYSEVYLPYFYKIASAYEHKFLSRFGDYGLRVDKLKIPALNSDPIDVSKEAREDVKAGIISPNEARLRIGLEESDQEGMNEIYRDGQAKQESQQG